MSDHYCKNLLKDGTCAKTGKLCLEALPSNLPNQELPTWLTTDNTITTIPAACKNCSNHPSNGGSGICFCTLGSISFTAGTTTGRDIQYTTSITSIEDE